MISADAHCAQMRAARRERAHAGLTFQPAQCSTVRRFTLTTAQDCRALTSCTELHAPLMSSTAMTNLAPVSSDASTMASHWVQHPDELRNISPRYQSTLLDLGVGAHEASQISMDSQKPHCTPQSSCFLSARSCHSESGRQVRALALHRFEPHHTYSKANSAIGGQQQKSPPQTESGGCFGAPGTSQAGRVSVQVDATESCTVAHQAVTIDLTALSGRQQPLGPSGPVRHQAAKLQPARHVVRVAPRL